MIDKLVLTDFKGIRQAELELRPFNVLIGRNDTGKSSILEALHLYSRLLSTELSQVLPAATDVVPTVRAGTSGCSLSVSTQHAEHTVALRPHVGGTPLAHEVVRRQGKLVCEIKAEPTNQGGIQFTKSVPLTSTSGADWGRHLLAELATTKAPLRVDVPDPRIPSEARASDTKLRESARQVLAKVTGLLADHVAACRAEVYKLDPYDLGRPVPLSLEPRPRLERRGFGLATFLDHLNAERPDVFQTIVDGMQARLPGLEHVVVGTTAIKGPGTLLGRHVRFFWQGLPGPVDAADSSDGALLFLAYLALVHAPDSPSVLLLEEPENGVHPEALQSVMGQLYALSRGELGKPRVQVVITTHSPLLLDLIEDPRELILCTKDEQGHIAVRNLPDPEEIRRVLGPVGLGEYWGAVGEEGLLR